MPNAGDLLMCGKDNDDPLVRRLFRDERLCLVRVARTPDELSPEKSIVTYPPGAREAAGDL